MKPKLNKTQRKALRFAYDLMRGTLNGDLLSYVRGSVLRTPDGGIHFYNRHWIEPDQAEDRPYLSEDILTSLVMHGYMETRPTRHQPPEQIWLYRVTRDGCDALGVDSLLYPPAMKGKFRDRLTSRRHRELTEREGLYKRRGGFWDQQMRMRSRGIDRHNMPFNYRMRNRK